MSEEEFSMEVAELRRYLEQMGKAVEEAIAAIDRKKFYRLGQFQPNTNTVLRAIGRVEVLRKVIEQKS